MRIISDLRAVSTFILIILILCSAVFGAFISYVLVMSSYYNMPENTTLLIVENVAFPILDFTYFNVTILNPSNSASDGNITAIRLSVEEKNEIHDVTKTEPELGTIRRGTKLTFKCEENWSNFAGEIVRIEPVAENASTKSYLYTTPKVKLILTPYFDVYRSVKYFDLTIENSAEPNRSLTVSEIRVFGTSINVTPALPYTLWANQMKTFSCNCNWEDYRGENVTITVKTSEGYESVYTTNELLGAVLYIDEVEFDYMDTSYFNLTITSSEYSTAPATIITVNITLQDGRTIPINYTLPPLGPMSGGVPRNSSRTFACTWNWKEYRGNTTTVNAYTRQGFAISGKTVKTPPKVVWNVTDVKFDLDLTDHFLLNVTNMPCSLQNITITQINFNENETGFESQMIPIGEEKVFNCTFDWENFVGEKVNITVLTEDGLNISRIVAIPSLELKLLDFVISELESPDLNVTVPYVNITISNSNNSFQNVIITKIILETANETYEIDGALAYPKLAPDGYVLKIGEKVIVVCLWNWECIGLSLKATVYTAEGFQVSRTWYPPFTP
jgi:hypothetical protein